MKAIDVNALSEELKGLEKEAMHYEHYWSKKDTLAGKFYRKKLAAKRADMSQFGSSESSGSEAKDKKHEDSD